MGKTLGTADTTIPAWEMAVKANMLYVGVAEADADAYINGLALSDSEDNKIETIIVEKYKSLYGNAPIEAWTDYRRTGFPSLSPNPNAVTTVNPSGLIPRRFLYPLSERQTNFENYDAAISAQGGHLLDDDTFVFPSN